MMIKKYEIFNSKYVLCALIGILIFISLYDLFSPPITRTMWRQTQTAMLTDNYVNNHFAINGLYINLQGKDKLMTVNEFPLYNFIVGIFFLLFNHNIFWGKFISLLASIISLIYLFKISNKLFGSSVALLGAMFFIFSPVGMLMRTAFQPDALCLMFLLISVYCLLEWRKQKLMKYFVLFSINLSFASLLKIPLIVPYLPVMILALSYDQGKIRIPKLKEMIIFFIFVIVPLIAWYFYRLKITDFAQRADDAKFLIGDLSRFVHLDYYIKPFFTIISFLWCGTGLLYFILGLRKSTFLDVVLLSGIPFYFIIVPTVSDQYYYYYALLPITALFMARGFILFYGYCVSNRKQMVFYTFMSLFIFSFLLATGFVLRHDDVMMSVAKAVEKNSAPSEFIISINIHDRGVAIGSNNTSLFYLANRKGWAIWGDYNNHEDMLKQIVYLKNKGAKWLAVTWYTSDLEPWFAPYTPKSLRRDPRINGRELYLFLEEKYKSVYLERNYAVMKLQ